MVKSLSDGGVDIAGLMTWSIGWDEQAGWPFAKAVAPLIVESDDDDTPAPSGDDDTPVGNVCDDAADTCNTCEACCHSYLDGDSCDACAAAQC